MIYHVWENNFKISRIKKRHLTYLTHGKNINNDELPGNLPDIKKGRLPQEVRPVNDSDIRIVFSRS